MHPIYRPDQDQVLLNVSVSRFLLTFLVGYIVASQLNWGIAEFVLNEWAMPRLDGFMREGQMAASGANISKLTFGFMLPLLVIALLQAAMVRPISWVARALLLAVLISIAAFYGTYTFISGWGNVNWAPLMVVATADMVCMIVGALIIGFLQQWRTP
jgi:hypothetical protein